DPIIPINTLQQSLPDKVRIIPTPPAKKQVNTEKFTTPKIEDVIPENDTPPLQDLLQGKQITEISVNKGSEEIIINDYETKSIDDTEKIYTTISIQEPATFPGGDGALMRFLKENINYPSIEKENGIQGKVFLSFIIDKDGSVTNIELFKGLKDGPGCDREAIRVTKLVPKWNPGKHNGNLVKMRFILPISFKLQ
ncbi:MAG TPA: energy transducer TonB, partial [Bacteroidia bacterium]|nr:energy transducer TonB [Bacteroidia bacterium]